MARTLIEAARRKEPATLAGHEIKWLFERNDVLVASRGGDWE